MPQNLTVRIASPTDVILSWNEPLESEKYGTILSYTISCYSLRYGMNHPYLSNVTSNIQEKGLSKLKLHPFDVYNCCVSASNQEGRGRPTCEIVVIEQTGIFVRIISSMLGTPPPNMGKRGGKGGREGRREREGGGDTWGEIE